MHYLPTHPRTGMTAIGWRRNGEPIWPVMGAAEDDDDQDDQGGQDDDAGAGSDDDADDSGDDAKLGDAGKRAIDRMKQQLREEKRRRREAEEKAAKASKPKADDGDKPDLEEIRRQAREEAAAEALRDRVMDKIEAKARKFADSEDAAAILLRSHQVEDFIDSGKVDVAAIAEALDELADAKPHLLARNGSNGGSFDTGRGKQRDKAQLSRDDLKNMTPQQIEAARKAGKLDRLMGKSK